MFETAHLLGYMPLNATFRVVSEKYPANRYARSTACPPVRYARRRGVNPGSAFDIAR